MFYFRADQKYVMYNRLCLSVTCIEADNAEDDYWLTSCMCRHPARLHYLACTREAGEGAGRLAYMMKAVHRCLPSRRDHKFFRL